jgi:hypothetical protein
MVGMSLEQYIRVAREKGLDPCQIEWRVNLISVAASTFGISPERIVDDVLDMEERNSCLPKSFLESSQSLRERYRS